MRPDVDPTLTTSGGTARQRECAGAVSCFFAVAVCLTALSMSACATTKAATVVNGPPLSVPEPPPRVLVPPEEEPLVATGNGPDTPLLSPRVQPTPPPSVRRNAPARGETDTRTETPAVSATAVGPNPPAEPPRELKPVLSAGEPPIDGTSVKTSLEKVDALLRSVAPSKYNTGTYREAKRFYQQALDKFNQRNFVSAAEAANKALQLATDLVGR